MTKLNELKWNYKAGEVVSTAAMVKAGYFTETETTKMLTAQINDATLTDGERVRIRTNIKRAGYVIEMTGNMKSPRVYEVTI